METNTENVNSRALLANGGEMGKLIQSIDWSKNPLGPIESWPQSLRTTVSLCLASNFPISIAWGRERIQIYNDGYLPICGDKHPKSMGQDFKECWLSAWPVIGEAFEQASAGKTRFLENQRMFLDRYGYLEETFFTFSFSPILDESGSVGGLFHPVTELTQQTLSERRLNILRTLADNTTEAKTVDEASSQIIETLKNFNMDLPFALFYAIHNDQTKAFLKDSTFKELETDVNAHEVNLDDPIQKGWPFEKVIESGKAFLVEDLEERFSVFITGPYPEPLKKAIMLPIVIPGTQKLYGVFIAGISTRRALDEPYRIFYDLLAGNVNNIFAKANALEEERKRAEALAAIDKAKTVFFSNVSHEFRTPLTLMLGPLEEALKDTDNTVANKERLGIAYRNAMRLLKLVNSLLDFSRIEAGRIQASFEPVDLSTFTAELASNFRSAVEKAGLQLTIKTEQVSEPIYVDRDMWEKIVLNLLSNAFKFTFEGEIEVSFQEHKRHVILKVKDTGIGISDQNLPDIFKRFNRVEGAKSRSFEGSGIGLSLVEELVKLHGGEIKVESVEHQGTAFTISIQKGTEHLPKERIGAERSLHSTSVKSMAFVEEAMHWLPSTNKDVDLIAKEKKEENSERFADQPRIVFADDNADMREYVKRLLQDSFEVQTVDNGLQALEAIRAKMPDLVLSDVMMPEMDGFELLKTLKENPETSSLPLILLSARAGEEAKIEGVRAGADDYLIKPFSSKELIARVTTHIRTSRIRYETERKLFSLFLSAPSMVLILQGPNYIIELANPVALQVLGRKGDEVLNKPLFEAIPELHEQGLDLLLDGVYATGVPYIGKELKVKVDREGNGNPEDLYFNIVYAPRYNHANIIEGVMCFANEVSEHIAARNKVEEYSENIKENNVELLAKNNQLTKINNDLDNFIYTASHDLKAPISNIEGLMNVLLNNLPEEVREKPTIKKVASMIEQSVNRFKSTILDLTEISKLQKQVGENTSIINLHELIEEVKFDMESEIEKTKAKIFTDLQNCNEVDFSEKNLRSIVYNLISNAIKYHSTERKPQIDISCRKEEGFYVIKVRDNGLGIDRAQHDKIFSMFKRVHTHVDGSGVGLYIVKRIIENSGDRIELESEVGKGSIFTVYLKANK